MNPPEAALAAAPSRDEKRAEMKIAAPFRDAFEWRLVLHALVLVGAWATSIAVVAAGALPYWGGSLLNGVLAYLCYMTLHEATHGNIAGRNPKLRWLNDAVGSISSIPLWFGYRAHRISHMKHHAYTNEPARDPDYFVAGPLHQLPLKYAILSTLQTLAPVLSLFPGGLRLLPAGIRARYEQRNRVIDSEERRQGESFQRLCVAAFLALSLAGYFKEAFWLWFVPSRIGFFAIFFVFAWLPHHPHNERGRYRDTRVTLFPGSTLLLRGQDHHILHHMFPRVPHYRLPALFKEMRARLEAKGARIEGPLAGPEAPAILMRWDPSMRAAPQNDSASP